MRPTIKILIVPNNCHWKTWGDKILELRRWFSPAVNLEVDISFQSFNDVPFERSPFSDPFEDLKDAERVSPTWYDENITPLATSHDIVLFVMNTTEWKGKSARGRRT